MDGPEGRMAPGCAPDRARGLPPAEGHPDAAGEELLLTSAPGSDLASRVARNSDAIAEKYAHLEGLPYGRVDISTTEFPGELVIGTRRVDPSVKGSKRPASPLAWRPR